MVKTRELGKFEGCTNQDLGKALYDLSLDGCDEELGDAQGFGWYGLLTDINIYHPADYIVYEDNQGFFDYVEYEQGTAIIDWNRLLKEEEEYTAQDYC